MPDSGAESARRERIEEIVLAGRRDALWTCWDETATDRDTGFAAAYAALMRWARSDPPAALRVVTALRRHGGRELDKEKRAALIRRIWRSPWTPSTCCAPTAASAKPR